MRKLGIVILIVTGMVVVGWGLGGALWSQAPNDGAATYSPGTSVFTPAHKTFLTALKEYVNWYSIPVQPIAFTHKVHLARGLQCTDCHQSVAIGPVAGIPGVRLCMTCHQVIATDKPEIKKVAGYLARGEEIPWQRVYYFEPSAHVFFQHAPHIRANVGCENCHGDMTRQTVAVRAVNLDMGYCLKCHRARGTSVDCTICHY